MKRFFACTVSLLTALVLGAVAQGPTASAASASPSLATAREFYRNKDVVLMVTTSPGGTYDLVARAIGPKLKQFLNARSVIVDNRPGGHITGANYVYSRAKPDGLTLLHWGLGSRGWSQLMRTPGIEFDVRKFISVGQFHPPPGAVLETSGALGVKTISDLKNLKQFRVGLTGRLSDVHLLTSLVFENFGVTNGRFIYGYKGSQDCLMAVQKGEIEATGSVTTASALNQKKAIESGVFSLFTVYSHKRAAAFPDVPTALELGQWRPDLKYWLEMAMSISALYQVWSLRPGTPPDRVALLRQTFEELWADPEVKKGLNRVFDGYAMFTGASETEKIINKTFPKQVFSEEEIARLRQLMEKWSS